MNIRFDGTSFNYTNGYTDNLADTAHSIDNNHFAYVSGKVETEERNATSHVSAFFRGAGYAMNDSSIDTCLMDGTTCYGVKIMPSITNVSHNSGFAAGG